MKHGKLNEKELHTGRRVWMLIPEMGRLDPVIITKAPYTRSFDLSPGVSKKLVARFVHISHYGIKHEIPVSLLNDCYMMFRTSRKGINWMQKFAIIPQDVARGRMTEIDSDVFAKPIVGSFIDEEKDPYQSEMQTSTILKTIINSRVGAYGEPHSVESSIIHKEITDFTAALSNIFLNKRRHMLRDFKRSLRKSDTPSPTSLLLNPSTEVRYSGQ